MIDQVPEDLKRQAQASFPLAPNQHFTRQTRRRRKKIDPTGFDFHETTDAESECMSKQPKLQRIVGS